MRIETHYHNAIEALLLSTRLTEVEGLNQDKVEAALGAVIDEWVDQWRKE